jgi:NAD(P)-dependent dehydrogenase (short-subunit alcohol dehydrogenase family)
MSSSAHEPPSQRRAVLITGCSSGVGSAAARLFREVGWDTFATARDLSKLDDLRAIGCRTLPLDVNDEAARRSAVETIESDFGAVGVLVNNAGYGQYGPLEQISLDDIRRQFETNVFGGGPCQRPGRRPLSRQQVRGRSSRGCAASGGRGFGIDVVNVLPGPIATHFKDALIETIPATTANDPYAVFKANIAKRMGAFLKPGQFGVMDADSVARVIVKAATVKRPRPRYNVGLVAKLGPLGRALLSDRLVDVVTRHQSPVE